MVSQENGELNNAEIAEQDTLCFEDNDISPVQECPLATKKKLVLIPRKRDNIFDPERYVKHLLPDRYPPGKDKAIKDIEYNFYPDLNKTRTITAVVTKKAWDPSTEQLPQCPEEGVTVYFDLDPATTADVKLSAYQATTDADGCASVNVTVNTLHTKKKGLKNKAKIVVVASLVAETTVSLEPATLSEVETEETLILTIHRNSDVSDVEYLPLGPGEQPIDFANTLRDVLEMKTWLVRQTKRHVTSNGAKAVQQLLNQVSCRKAGGGHTFLKPDGQYGAGSRAEIKRFINDFKTPPAKPPTLQDYNNCNFNVSVEEDEKAKKGVKTYVKAEYGSYSDGDLVDAHLLVGMEEKGRWWTAGPDKNVMDADGLLDIYAAVVWEFIEKIRERAMEYVNVNTNWYRHPKDNGPAPGPVGGNWPEAVTDGVAYGYGCARSLTDFQNDLLNITAASNATQNLSGFRHWFRYLHDHNCRIGIHAGGGNNNRVDIPSNIRNVFNHLQNDPTIANGQINVQIRDATGTLINDANNQPVFAAHNRLSHQQNNHCGQYTGIDCSGFIQQVATEARFRAAHCADLANERICREVPVVTHRNGWATKLNCTTWNTGNHYRRLTVPQWRRDVMFRGDILNRPANHIVMLDVANRETLSKNNPPVGEIWIIHSNGTVTVPVAAQNDFAPNQCPRRVIRSPLAQYQTGWGSWTTNNNNVHFGRIYLWD